MIYRIELTNAAARDLAEGIERNLAAGRQLRAWRDNRDQIGKAEIEHCFGKRSWCSARRRVRHLWFPYGVQPVQGSFVVALLGDTDQVTFKQYVIDGRHYLKPLNPRYPVLEMDDHVALCGVVKQMIMTFE